MTDAEIKAISDAMGKMKDTPPVTPVTKPAWQTTEFWGHVLVVLLGLLVMSGVIKTGSQLDKVVSMIAMALSQAGYSVSRGITKAASLKK
jgi:hypothetical protein